MLDATENLARLAFDPRDLALDPTADLKVLLGTQDGRPEEVVLRAEVPTSAWSWDANRGELTLFEHDASAWPKWTVQP